MTKVSYIKTNKKVCEGILNRIEGEKNKNIPDKTDQN